MELYGAVRKSPLHDTESKRKNGVFGKQTATSTLLSIPELKKCKTLVGCDAVNDIIIAMVAGAFMRMLKTNGYPMDEYFGFSVPKSYRTAEHPDLSNNVGWYVIFVPSTIASIADRACAVSKIMREAKNSKDADIGYALTRSQVHVWDLDREAQTALGARLIANVTNLPQPINPIRFGPAQMANYVPLAPIGSPGTVNVAVCPVDGKVMYMSAQFDKDVEAKTGFFKPGAAKELCAAFEAEYKELLDVASRIEAGQRQHARI